jgi:Spy/CpxP family protein refolding chaperone
LGDSPTPPTGKRVCNMKGKGMMAGPDMGPGKACGCPGHQGGRCGHGGGPGGMHADMAQRLDLIEARLAKIEAMLESLMRR